MMVAYRFERMFTDHYCIEQKLAQEGYHYKKSPEGIIYVKVFCEHPTMPRDSFGVLELNDGWWSFEMTMSFYQDTLVLIGDAGEIDRLVAEKIALGYKMSFDPETQLCQPVERM